MKRLIIIIALGVLVSCQNEQKELQMAEVDLMKLPKVATMDFLPPEIKEEEITEEPDTVVVPSVPGLGHQVKTKPNQQKPVERQIIRNADLSFQVDDVKKSEKNIELIVKNLNGIITSSEETRQESEIRHLLTIRLPAARLDSFLVLVLKESIYTESKNVTADDVTKRYVDLDARIRSKKATENKYLELLKKAQNIKDVLAVEDQLRIMREEIEVQQAEFRELKGNVAMSTVNANFYQKIEGVDAPEKSFFAKIYDNLKDGLDFLNSFILGIFYYLPLLLVLSCVGWLARRWWKTRK